MIVRRSLITFLAFLTICGLAAGGALYFALEQFRGPGLLENDKIVIFQKGAALSSISMTLADAGVIAYPLLFKFGVWWNGADRQLKPGEYKFPANISPFQTMAQMREGRRVARRVTIPEGLTVAEIIRLLRSTDGLTDDDLRPIPEEGSLLPETYFYAWGDNWISVLDRMQRAMQDSLNEMWEKRDTSIAWMSPRDVLVLASIIEKETGKPAERARVSAVFHNRLKRGMRLQSDATVIYDLTNGEGALGRELTRADLDKQTVHNTYRIDALPPTPIGNPGKAALAAALHPEPTKELYFVADGMGGHRFAETYLEHNRNILLLRRLQAARVQRKSG